MSLLDVPVSLSAENLAPVMLAPLRIAKKRMFFDDQFEEEVLGFSRRDPSDLISIVPTLAGHSWQDGVHAASSMLLALMALNTSTITVQGTSGFVPTYYLRFLKIVLPTPIGLNNENERSR